MSYDSPFFVVAPNLSVHIVYSLGCGKNTYLPRATGSPLIAFRSGFIAGTLLGTVWVTCFVYANKDTQAVFRFSGALQETGWYFTAAAAYKSLKHILSSLNKEIPRYTQRTFILGFPSIQALYRQTPQREEDVVPLGGNAMSQLHTLYFPAKLQAMATIRIRRLRELPGYSENLHLLELMPRDIPLPVSYRDTTRNNKGQPLNITHN